jgi:hypothetical protein
MSIRSNKFDLGLQSSDSTLGYTGKFVVSEGTRQIHMRIYLVHHAYWMMCIFSIVQSSSAIDHSVNHPHPCPNRLIIDYWTDHISMVACVCDQLSTTACEGEHTCLHIDMLCTQLCLITALTAPRYIIRGQSFNRLRPLYGSLQMQNACYAVWHQFQSLYRIDNLNIVSNWRERHRQHTHTRTHTHTHTHARTHTHTHTHTHAHTHTHTHM